MIEIINGLEFSYVGFGGAEPKLKKKGGGIKGLKTKTTINRFSPKNLQSSFL